jgi:hypothetical protein
MSAMPRGHKRAAVLGAARGLKINRRRFYRWDA